MTKLQRTLLTITVLFLLGGLVLAAYLTKQIIRPTPQAAEKELTFSLKSSNPSPEPGEEIRVELFAIPPTNDTQIRSLAAYINYNESIEITNLKQSINPPFDQWTYIKFRDNKANYRIEILAVYRPLETNLSTDGYLRNNPALFGTINLRWKGGQPGKLALVTKSLTSEGKDSEGNAIKVQPASISFPNVLETPLQILRNPVSWRTAYVALKADDFYIIADGEKYLAKTKLLKESSSPDDSNHTTLELTWRENDREMRLNMYFRSDGEEWWSPEIRTYNGRFQGDWIYYTGRFFETELGTSFVGNVDISSDPKNQFNGSIHFENLRLLAFINQTPPNPSSSPGNAVLSLTPASGEVSAGGTFDTTIMLDTGGNDVSGVDAIITFDPSVLQVVSTSKGEISEFITYFENIDNEAGRVTISELTSPDTSRTHVNGQNLEFATATFKTLPPVTDNTTRLDFDFTLGKKNDSNVADLQEGRDILASVNGARYTILHTPTAGTALKLKPQLCDESSQPNIVIKFPDDSNLETKISGQNEGTGTLHTTNLINIPEGLQSLTVHVVGHLSHTFQLPSAWINTIDLSSYTLSGGGDIERTGKVNTLDFNLFKAAYLSSTTESDLGCSGQVNSLDYNYNGVVSNWNKTSE